MLGRMIDLVMSFVLDLFWVKFCFEELGQIDRFFLFFYLFIFFVCLMV